MSIKTIKAVRLDKDQFAMFYSVPRKDFVEEFSAPQIAKQNEILEIIERLVTPGEVVEVIEDLRSLPIGQSTTFRYYRAGVL